LSDSKNHEFFPNLCRKVLDTDSAIRFVGIANNLGTILASEYRANLVPLMNKDETKQYAIQAVTRTLLRETFEPNIGKLQFSIGFYDKLIRATIPFSKDGQGDYFALVSFDQESDAVFIIRNRIIPVLKQSK
jgi:hypothetical protein